MYIPNKKWKKMLFRYIFLLIDVNVYDVWTTFIEKSHEMMSTRRLCTKHVLMLLPLHNIRKTTALQPSSPYLRLPAHPMRFCMTRPRWPQPLLAPQRPIDLSWQTETCREAAWCCQHPILLLLEVRAASTRSTCCFHSKYVLLPLEASRLLGLTPLPDVWFGRVRRQHRPWHTWHKPSSTAG